MSVVPKTSGKLFFQKLSMLSDPLFVFPPMKLPMNASWGSHVKPWLVLRSLRGYCIRAPSFSAAIFATRATPCATRLTSWRVIRRIPWYVLVMARSAQFLRLTWRLFPGLPPSPKSSQQTLPRLPRHRAMWTVSSPIALAIRRQPLSRRGWPRRRALTLSRHRHVQICRPYAVQHELESPLIVLVIGPYNFTGGECDGFVSMPPLISLITCHADLHCLITCRVDLHWFAWSFVSHVYVRWLLVSYQAFVVLRCRCWCVLNWIKPSERFPSSLGSVVTLHCYR